MSAIIFSGNPGVGKTYKATALVLCAIDVGKRVAVNWDLIDLGVPVVDLRNREITPEDNLIAGPVVFRYDEYKEVDGLCDADIYNDEAQAQAGARDWESMGKKTRLWLSMHRHFGTNLLFFTQHYKFVDVYFRRLSVGHAWSLHRFFNFTLSIPRPQADPETGELGTVDIFGFLAVMRPWKDLDHPNPIPAFWKLLFRSRQVTKYYRTRSPKKNN